jgi:uncharacterized OB-fold protein
MKIPFCRGCGKYFFFPRPICPNCWSSEVEFRPANGTGRIYSYTVVRFAHAIPSEWHKQLPYVVALIELDEGIRIMSNVIGCDVDTVRSGSTVRLTYHDFGGRTLPAFELAS